MNTTTVFNSLRQESEQLITDLTQNLTSEAVQNTPELASLLATNAQIVELCAVITEDNSMRFSAETEIEVTKQIEMKRLSLALAWERLNHLNGEVLLAILQNPDHTNVDDVLRDILVSKENGDVYKIAA